MRDKSQRLLSTHKETIVEKHAYLLMIHENNNQLYRLLQLLDDDKNDIYIHIDIKCKNISPLEIQNKVVHSQVYFCKRVNVTWSGYSLVKAELNLLRAAVTKKYSYYHLLSASDFPIKSQKEIHDWFLQNAGKEFVHFGTKEYQQGIVSKYNVYHFFQEKMGRGRNNRFYNKLETYSLAAQRRLHVNRSKNREACLYGGANWFSITDDLANFVLEHIKDYKNELRFTQNCDEIFLQTIVMNSEFKNRLYISGCNDDYHQIMRYIDWARGENGGPHTFTIEDYNELIHSEYLFARKFNEKIDNNVIDKICEYVKER